MFVNLNTIFSNISEKMAFNFEIFDEKCISFERWQQRLENAFNLFLVTDDKIKKSCLLHYIGTQYFNVICDNLFPQSPLDEDVSYSIIIGILDDYFKNKKAIVSRRFYILNIFFLIYLKFKLKINSFFKVSTL